MLPIAAGASRLPSFGTAFPPLIQSLNNMIITLSKSKNPHIAKSFIQTGDEQLGTYWVEDVPKPTRVFVLVDTKYDANNKKVYTFRDVAIDHFEKFIPVPKDKAYTQTPPLQGEITKNGVLVYHQGTVRERLTKNYGLIQYISKSEKGLIYLRPLKKPALDYPLWVKGMVVVMRKPGCGIWFAEIVDRNKNTVTIRERKTRIHPRYDGKDGVVYEPTYGFATSKTNTVEIVDGSKDPNGIIRLPDDTIGQIYATNKYSPDWESRAENIYEEHSTASSVMMESAKNFPKWKKNTLVDVKDSSGKLTDVFDVMSRRGNVVTVKHRIKNTGEEPWTTVVEIESNEEHPEGFVRIPHNGAVMIGTFGGIIHHKKEDSSSNEG